MASTRYPTADNRQGLLYPDRVGVGENLGDTWGCASHVNLRQDQKNRSLSPAQQEAMWRAGRLGQVPELVGGGHGSYGPGICLTAQRSQEDSKGGRLRVLCVDFWSLS